MPTYVYRAVTKTGVVVKNKVEAVDKQHLTESLKENGLLPISIEQMAKFGLNRQKKPRRNVTNLSDIMKNVNTTQIGVKAKQSTKEKIDSYFAKTEKITQRDVAIFTQDFYLLKKANFNNIHALETIIEGTENQSFKEVLQDILSGVEAGDSMYATMEYYSNIFPYIYTNIIKVGELSGSLIKALEQAIKYLDDKEKLNTNLKNILIPNIIQFVLLIIMLIVGTMFAIPAIQGVFEELGTEEELPALTLWFSDFIDGLVTHWYIPVFLILAIVGAVIFYINTPKGRYNFHTFKYKMPIFGQLIYALDFSRLMKAMLLNLRNGLRIQESLEISKNVVKNEVMLSIIETSMNNMLIGSSWVEPFEEAGFSKPMVTEMLKIGMQTNLEEMIEKVVEYMDIDIENLTNKIMKVLPQVVYAIVGVLLIFFVLIVLVPCVQVYMGNFLFSAYGV